MADQSGRFRLLRLVSGFSVPICRWSPWGGASPWRKDSIPYSATRQNKRSGKPKLYREKEIFIEINDNDIFTCSVREGESDNISSRPTDQLLGLMQAFLGKPISTGD